MEGLGQIPAHWTVGRVKECATVRLSNVDKKVVEGELHVRLCNYTDVYYHDRIDSGLGFMQATAKPEQVRRFSLRRGDVLITKDSEGWMDIAVPAVVAEDLPDVLCGYHLALIRPKPPCLGAFLGAAIGAACLRDQYRVSANGVTRFGLTGDAIRSGVLPLPPPSEQRDIADFLTRESAAIEQLVKKQERLIGLFGEQRTALTTRAVTRGLNADVPMKESGVEWLGDVPEHWDVRELRHLIVGRLTYGANVPADYTDPAWPRYLRITDFSPDGTLRPDTFRSLPPNVAKNYLVEPGDVLLARSGATVGKAFLVREGSGRACHAGYLVRARPDFSLLLPDFLFAFARSASFAMWKEMTLIIATIQNIGADKYANLPVPTPPLEEQRAVVAFLDRETSRIDALVGKAKDVIKKLEEYRMALISAAVTGKIDVRNHRDGRTVTDPGRLGLMS